MLFSAVFGPAPEPAWHPHLMEWNGVGAIFSTAKREPAAARPSPDRWCTASAPSVSSRRCRRGAVRPEVICSILGEEVVAVADPGRAEADFRCFPALFAPPQLALEHLHVVEWNGVGAIFSTAKRGPGHNGRLRTHCGAHRALSVPQGDCARGLSGGRNLLHTGGPGRSRGRLWPYGGGFVLFSGTFCPAPTVLEYFHLMEWNGVGTIYLGAARPLSGVLWAYGAPSVLLGDAGWGAVRPGAICSILSRPGVAVPNLAA